MQLFIRALQLFVRGLQLLGSRLVIVQDARKIVTSGGELHFQVAGAVGGVLPGDFEDHDEVAFAERGGGDRKNADAGGGSLFERRRIVLRGCLDTAANGVAQRARRQFGEAAWQAEWLEIPAPLDHSKLAGNDNRSGGVKGEQNAVNFTLEIDPVLWEFKTPILQ